MSRLTEQYRNIRLSMICRRNGSTPGALNLDCATGDMEISNNCNKCDYSSKWAADLRKNLKVHSEEKSYKCNQCEFACIQSSNFWAHLKTHSGVVVNDTLVF